MSNSGRLQAFMEMRRRATILLHVLHYFTFIFSSHFYSFSVLVIFSFFILEITATDVMCVSKARSFCKKLRGHHPLRAKIWSSEKVAFGGVNISCVSLLANNFGVSTNKSTKFFDDVPRGVCDNLSTYFWGPAPLKFFGQKASRIGKISDSFGF